MIQKKLIVGTLLTVSFFTLTACGNKNQKTKAKKEFVKESSYSSFFSDPEKYKGKYIKLSGKIFNIDTDDDITAMQAWYDTENSDKDFLFTTKATDNYQNNDYVKIEGEIIGTFEGENNFGSKITSPQIKATKVEKSSYKDVVRPTLKEKTVNLCKKQHSVTFTIKKIEYAKDETRVYTEVQNNSKYKVSVYPFSAKAVQNGKQIKQESNYEGDYKEIDGEILPNAKDEGILCFDTMDLDKPLTIIQEASSDNYNIEMKNFEFKIK